MYESKKIMKVTLEEENAAECFPNEVDEMQCDARISGKEKGVGR